MANKKNFLLLFGLFFLISIVSFISAQNITIDYPDEVGVGEEFVINIGLEGFDSGVYDVKIDIKINDVRISRIFNEGVWKSTNYYVNAVLSSGENKDFTLKINEGVAEGEADILVRIRDEGGYSTTFTGYLINIVDSVIEDSSDNGKENNNDNNTENTPNTPYYIVTDNNQTEEQINITPTTISLNPQKAEDIKTENDSENKGKDKFQWLLLAVFCILLFFLYVVNKKHIKDKNEFT